jgi:hypothetical protein
MIATAITEVCGDQFISKEGWVLIMVAMTFAACAYKILRRVSGFYASLMVCFWIAGTGMTFLSHAMQHRIGADVRFKTTILFNLVLGVVEFVTS